MGSPLDECLNDLDGQRLVSVEQAGALLIFEFDQQASLEITQSKEDGEPQWSLHRWNGDVAELRRERIVLFDKEAYATASASEG
jgi:hypothetical protein